MTTFPLRLTDELKAMATAQAARAGVSLNQYIATLLAAHVGAQAEAERYFAARARRAKPEVAREISGASRAAGGASGGGSGGCGMTAGAHCINDSTARCQHSAAALPLGLTLPRSAAAPPAPSPARGRDDPAASCPHSPAGTGRAAAVPAPLRSTNSSNAPGNHGRQDIEAIRRVAGEPFLQRIRDALRRAAQHPVAARRRGQVVQVPQRHLLAPRHLVQHAVEGPAAFARPAAAAPGRPADGRTRRSRSGW